MNLKRNEEVAKANTLYPEKLILLCMDVSKDAQNE